MVPHCPSAFDLASRLGDCLLQVIGKGGRLWLSFVWMVLLTRLVSPQQEAVLRNRRDLLWTNYWFLSLHTTLLLPSTLLLHSYHHHPAIHKALQTRLHPVSVTLSLHLPFSPPLLGAFALGVSRSPVMVVLLLRFTPRLQRGQLRGARRTEGGVCRMRLPLPLSFQNIVG